MSDQKVPVARLAKPAKTEFTRVNEYFGGKRNAANGTLWTDSMYSMATFESMRYACLPIRYAFRLIAHSVVLLFLYLMDNLQN